MMMNAFLTLVQCRVTEFNDNTRYRKFRIMMQPIKTDLNLDKTGQNLSKLGKTGQNCSKHF